MGCSLVVAQFPNMTRFINICKRAFFGMIIDHNINVVELGRFEPFQLAVLDISKFSCDSSA